MSKLIFYSIFSILIQFALFVPSVAGAHPSDLEVSRYIDQQLAIEDSKFNEKLRQLFMSNTFFGKTQFLIHEPGLMFNKPEESFKDCDNQVCKLYLRKVYSKISSFRTDWTRGKNHSIIIQFLEIVVSSRKTWIFDANMKPEKLVEDRLVLEGIYYLN